MSVNFLLKPWEQKQQHPLSYPDMSHLHQAENLLASPPDYLFTPQNISPTTPDMARRSLSTPGR